MRQGELSVPDAHIKHPHFGVPGYVRFAAILFRSIFIIALLIVTVWVSRPQYGDIGPDHFTPGDFVRAALGVLACLWMFVNLFILPKDAQGYRTWAYLGLALTPLIIISYLVFW